ncbi:hypothetical protein ThrDRAFT_02733 [Frankia casuarinae]|jgi:hypothetical protein|uniref:Rpn family recombination-promoting nuclease/putative transposase n=1 Tax=Frankia TaxID=1854 RepID=UPI0003CFD12E|nr:hypothetical protein CcI6DRAFT_04818 [Frankia sp. CcI6]EYT91610.1 hypothetical protein ThrDRAFT_02733 [Frankia casuarinae]KDA41166.1 hypothetical protein BMG523Draft_03998 [Frankia sp. BMG5.23]KFB03724.1 hypothetical protein ALLO2DRAFT_03529 [Frankia sp. Allo2]TFE27060.1 hypothetical protein E0F15_16765 [Frankia sp. B2]
MSCSSPPHDAVCRRILGTPSNAASQLRAVLPSGLLARLDFAQPGRDPGREWPLSYRQTGGGAGGLGVAVSEAGKDRV